MDRGRLARAALAAAATVSALALGPAGAAGATLYDQIDETSPESTTSQNFEPMFNTFDSVAADDFTVPAGETWSLTSAVIRGTKMGATTTSSVNVTIYEDNGGVPGSSIFAGQLSATGFPRFDVDMSSVPTLEPGTYWLAVQAELNAVSFADPQQWFWAENSDQSGHLAVFSNPGQGFANTCGTFGPRSTCLPAHPAPDQSFSLSGTKTDSVPPATKIDKKPGTLKLHGKKKTVTATFKFSSSESGSTFKCKVDKGARKSCHSPFKVRLKKGRHQFQVTATDPAGNADPTPAKAKVRVKKAS